MPKLYEILIPIEMPCNGYIKPIRAIYHRVWDDAVRNITGGITILKPVDGQWLSPRNNLYSEKMIPVRIMCTNEQMEEIVKYTAEYYNQKAVMYYVISSEVFIREFND